MSEFYGTTEAMWVIHKFTMRKPEESFSVPQGTVLLNAGVQDGNIVVWYLRTVTEDILNLDNIRLRAMTTGLPQQAREFWTFLGTVQTGILVWHIFYERKRK